MLNFLIKKLIINIDSIFSRELFLWKTITNFIHQLTHIIKVMTITKNKKKKKLKIKLSLIYNSQRWIIISFYSILIALNSSILCSCLIYGYQYVMRLKLMWIKSDILADSWFQHLAAFIYNFDEIIKFLIYRFIINTSAIEWNKIQNAFDKYYTDGLVLEFEEVMAVIYKISEKIYINCEQLVIYLEIPSKFNFIPEIYDLSLLSCGFFYHGILYLGYLFIFSIIPFIEFLWFILPQGLFIFSDCLSYFLSLIIKLPYLILECFITFSLDCFAILEIVILWFINLYFGFWVCLFWGSFGDFFIILPTCLNIPDIIPVWNEIVIPAWAFTVSEFEIFLTKFFELDPFTYGHDEIRHMISFTYEIWLVLGYAFNVALAGFYVLTSALSIFFNIIKLTLGNFFGQLYSGIFIHGIGSFFYLFFIWIKAALSFLTSFLYCILILPLSLFGPYYMCIDNCITFIYKIITFFINYCYYKYEYIKCWFEVWISLLIKGQFPNFSGFWGSTNETYVSLSSEFQGYFYQIYNELYFELIDFINNVCYFIESDVIQRAISFLAAIGLNEINSYRLYVSDEWAMHAPYNGYDFYDFFIFPPMYCLFFWWVYQWAYCRFQFVYIYDYWTGQWGKPLWNFLDGPDDEQVEWEIDPDNELVNLSKEYDIAWCIIENKRNRKYIEEFASKIYSRTFTWFILYVLLWPLIAMYSTVFLGDNSLFLSSGAAALEAHKDLNMPEPMMEWAALLVNDCFSEIYRLQGVEAFDYLFTKDLRLFNYDKSHDLIKYERFLEPVLDLTSKNGGDYYDLYSLSNPIYERIYDRKEPPKVICNNTLERFQDPSLMQNLKIIKECSLSFINYHTSYPYFKYICLGPDNIEWVQNDWMPKKYISWEEDSINVLSEVANCSVREIFFIKDGRWSLTWQKWYGFSALAEEFEFTKELYHEYHSRFWFCAASMFIAYPGSPATYFYSLGLNYVSPASIKHVWKSHHEALFISNQNKQFIPQLIDNDIELDQDNDLTEFSLNWIGTYQLNLPKYKVHIPSLCYKNNDTKSVLTKPQVALNTSSFLEVPTSTGVDDYYVPSEANKWRYYKTLHPLISNPMDYDYSRYDERPGAVAGDDWILWRNSPDTKYKMWSRKYSQDSIVQNPNWNVYNSGRLNLKSSVDKWNETFQLTTNYETLELFDHLVSNFRLLNKGTDYLGFAECLEYLSFPWVEDCTVCFPLWVSFVEGQIDEPYEKLWLSNWKRLFRLGPNDWLDHPNGEWFKYNILTQLWKRNKYAPGSQRFFWKKNERIYSYLKLKEDVALVQNPLKLKENYDIRKFGERYSYLILTPQSADKYCRDFKEHVKSWNHRVFWWGQNDGACDQQYEQTQEALRYDTWANYFYPIQQVARWELSAQEEYRPKTLSKLPKWRARVRQERSNWLTYDYERYNFHWRKHSLIRWWIGRNEWHSQYHNKFIVPIRNGEITGNQLFPPFFFSSNNRWESYYKRTNRVVHALYENNAQTWSQQTFTEVNWDFDESIQLKRDMYYIPINTFLKQFKYTNISNDNFSSNNLYMHLIKNSLWRIVHNTWSLYLPTNLEHIVCNKCCVYTGTHNAESYTKSQSAYWKAYEGKHIHIMPSNYRLQADVNFSGYLNDQIAQEALRRTFNSHELYKAFSTKRMYFLTATSVRSKRRKETLTLLAEHKRRAEFYEKAIQSEKSSTTLTNLIARPNSKQRVNKYIWDANPRLPLKLQHNYEFPLISHGSIPKERLYITRGGALENETGNSWIYTRLRANYTPMVKLQNISRTYHQKFYKSISTNEHSNFIPYNYRYNTLDIIPIYNRNQDYFDYMWLRASWASWLKPLDYEVRKKAMNYTSPNLYKIYSGDRTQHISGYLHRGFIPSTDFIHPYAKYKPTYNEWRRLLQNHLPRPLNVRNWTGPTFYRWSKYKHKGSWHDFANCSITNYRGHSIYHVEELFKIYKENSSLLEDVYLNVPDGLYWNMYTMFYFTGDYFLGMNFDMYHNFTRALQFWGIIHPRKRRLWYANDGFRPVNNMSIRDDMANLLQEQKNRVGSIKPITGALNDQYSNIMNVQQLIKQRYYGSLKSQLGNYYLSDAYFELYLRLKKQAQKSCNKAKHELQLDYIDPIEELNKGNPAFSRRHGSLIWDALTEKRSLTLYRANISTLKAPLTPYLQNEKALSFSYLWTYKRDVFLREAKWNEIFKMEGFSFHLWNWTFYTRRRKLLSGRALHHLSTTSWLYPKKGKWVKEPLSFQMDKIYTITPKTFKHTKSLNSYIGQASNLNCRNNELMRKLFDVSTPYKSNVNQYITRPTVMGDINNIPLNCPRWDLLQDFIQLTGFLG